MKFRVSKKDLTMFIVFCVFLLYICAIVVVNISEFSATGSFAGLNPFPAFTKDYFAATLTLFTMALILIFTSVSTYIFDKEKGKGIGLRIGEKEEKTYSRWSTESEIKKCKNIEKVDPKAAHIDYAGVPLINNSKGMWVDNGEYHNLVIGATGSGKSVLIVKPMVNLLSKKGESMIITDPKGELYKESAEYLKNCGYNIITLNFREPERGNAWNPLTLPYTLYKAGNRDKAVELLDDVALNILYDPNNKDDPFWERSAADYFAGLSLGLFEDASESQININSINYMSSAGEEKIAGNSTYAREYFSLKGENSTPYTFASNTITAPTETRGSILSVFRQKIRKFSTQENLSEMLSYSDFDMRKIGEEKTAVFIIIHDEKTTYHSLATIFIKQCYETLVDCAQSNGGKLKIRTNFILDEFANMPPLNDVDAMVTAARSRLIRFTFIIQNFAQLKDVYNNKAETIKGNCGNLIYLISTELQALEEISKMCGEVKSKEKDKTVSTPLVSITDLQKLKLFEAIIIRWRMAPFKTKFTPSFEMDWGINFEESKYPTRLVKGVDLFDLKSFVKEERQKKFFENMNNMQNGMPNSGPNPLGPSGMPSGGPNPFGPSGMPSGGPSPFGPPGMPSGGPNPFGPNMSHNMGMPDMMGNGPQSNPGIDELMKKIDEQIAKLEEEERLEKENAMKQANEKPEPKEETKEVEEAPKEELKKDLPVQDASFKEKEETPKNNVSNKDLPKPKVNIDNDSVVVDENVVTDDQFFDDFFGDDL